MTDLHPITPPPDLTDKWNNLPQGEHAPGPQPLSPAAQAVMDAYWQAPLSNKASVAAALRAAVKQTRKRKVLKTLWVTMVKGPIYCLEADLLAIATELEAQP